MKPTFILIIAVLFLVLASAVHTVELIILQRHVQRLEQIHK